MRKKNSTAIRPGKKNSTQQPGRKKNSTQQPGRKKTQLNNLEEKKIIMDFMLGCDALNMKQFIYVLIQLLISMYENLLKLHKGKVINNLQKTKDFN